MTIQHEEGTYDFIRATVTEDGIALAYQVTGLAVEGSDLIDDPGAISWPDSDVRMVAASYLGVTEGTDEIEVSFE